MAALSHSTNRERRASSPAETIVGSDVSVPQGYGGPDTGSAVVPQPIGGGTATRAQWLVYLASAG